MKLKTNTMTVKEAIREMKKMERIITKLTRAGYDVSIIECDKMVLATNALAEERYARMNAIDMESKEGGLNDNEVVYMFRV